MKIRSKVIGETVVCLLVLVLVLWENSVVLASSSNTILLTNVPSHFVVDVTIVGGGCVIINGTELTQSAKISLERHKEVHIRLSPERNRRVDSVVYNGTSIINELNGEEILLSKLEDNGELEVTFANDWMVPDTGDTSIHNVICNGIIAIISLSIIVLFVDRRMCYKK